MDRPQTPWGLLTVTLLVGGGVGYLIGAAGADAPDTAPEPTAAIPLTESPEEASSQAEIDALEAELAEARTALASLRDDEAASKADVIAAESRITELEAALASTRAALNGSRDALAASEAQRIEQQQVLIDVSTQAIEHRDASTVNLWHAFTADAELQMCSRGTRAARERCQEGIREQFDLIAFERFESCVEEHGTIPLFDQTSRGTALPEGAERMTIQSGIFTRDWYVLYCDPALPTQDGERLASSPVRYGRL